MLALVGSGEYLPEVDLIDHTLMQRLAQPARVVCLPTAAGREGDAMIQSWMDRGVQHFTRLGANVTALKVWDHQSSHDQAFANTIREANFIYISGGHPGYLAECYHQSPVWEAILSVHARGDIVAGCSAGAMIMGEKIIGPGGNRDGFKLIPNAVIMPHFDEFIGRMSRVGRFFGDKTLKMIGIDGRTALIKNNDGSYEAAGSGHITVFDQDSKHSYSNGQQVKGV